MRKGFLFVCILVLLLCLYLALHRPAVPGQHSVTVETPQSNPPPVEMVQPNQNVSPVKPVQTTAPNSPAGKLDRLNEYTNFNRAILTQWQAPIDFYGIVVDENTNPVAGAGIEFDWSEMPSENGERTSSTESDAQGMFALHGAKGASLDVKVSKQGYYTSHKDAWSFPYAINGHFYADARNPVIFHLRKKSAGEDLIHVKQNFHVPRDGSPVGINLTTGKTLAGGGDIIVQCWTYDGGTHPGQKYNWDCLVTVPNGGLVISDEEFPFQAPESGYMPTNEIAMPANFPGWQNNADISFFYQLPNGDYGRLKFSMVAGGQHFCMVDSWLNPTGSRNLEPK